MTTSPGGPSKSKVRWIQDFEDWLDRTSPPQEWSENGVLAMDYGMDDARVEEGESPVETWESVEGSIVTGIAAIAGQPDSHGNVLSEEACRSLAEQANNLEFKEGVLYAHGEIKDGKLVIEYPGKQQKETETDG